MTLQILLAASKPGTSALLACVLLFAGPALGQTLEARIGATPAGTTLTLPAGFKGGGYVRNIARSPPVTVKCADTTCLLTDVKLQASPGIIFDGPVFASGGVNPALAITAGSHGSGVQNCKVYGLKALTGGGVSIADSNGAFVTNCEITDLSGGINVLRSQGVAVTNNRIHNFSVDAVQFSGSNNVTFTGNKVWDSFPVPGAHNDAVQFFTLNTTSPTHDLLIEGNVFWRGKGQVFQGVFMGNEAKIPYDRVTIRGNTILGTMYNGLAVYQATNAVIWGNTVTGFPDMVSWISTSGVTGTVAGNRAQQFNTPAAVGLTLTGNIVIPASTDGGAAILAALNPVPTPVPVPVPAPSGPTQAELDAANAQIVQLTISLDAAKAQDVVDLANVAAAQKAVSDAQAVAASLQVALTAAQTEATRKQALLDNIAALAVQ